MLQALIFSAGFLLGAADGVQALTPPEPLSVPEEKEEIQLASVVRRQPEAVFPGSAGVPPATNQVTLPAGRRRSQEKRDPAISTPRPSPLAKAAFLVPAPAVKAERPVRKSVRLPRTRETYASMFREAAERHSLSPALVEAVARVESGFNPRALSHKGARGLMQVIPATGRRFGVRSDKLYDPEHNIAAGTAYLAWLSKRYAGNLDFIIAAYNAGEGAVDDHGGIPPYRETRDYVRKVKAVLSKIEERGVEDDLE